MSAISPRATVVVIGGGLAGLSAAIEAEEAGATVFLLEKMPRIGGNSAKASSGINAALTHWQRHRNISDSPEMFYRDILESGGRTVQRPLVDVLVHHSNSAIDWLEKFGISLNNVCLTGGHTAPRTHRQPLPHATQDGKVPPPVGYALIDALHSYATGPWAGGRIQIINDATVKRLIPSDPLPGLSTPGVRGVVYSLKDSNEEIFLEADAVILCTGGFSANKAMLEQLRPDLVDIPTTNGHFAQGDGIKLAESAGASTLDMDKIQVHPTSFVDPANSTAQTKFLAPESMRAWGALLVNKHGHRFVNELARRDEVSAEIFKHAEPFRGLSGVPNLEMERVVMPADKLKKIDAATNYHPTSHHFEHGHEENGTFDEKQPPVVFMILNSAVVDKFGRGYTSFYMSKGLIRKYSTAALACEDTGINLDGLVETFHDLHIASLEGRDCFGKTFFPVNFEAEDPIWVAIITPAVHYTMGGIRINGASEVLAQIEETYKPIPGLFAAGEVTGGIHGKNRLAGNSLLETVVFGRIAGKRAAHITLANQPLFERAIDGGPLYKHWLPLRLREREDVTNEIKLFRFDLPSSLHTLHMDIGEYLSIRTTCHQKCHQLIRNYSPVSRPDDYGVLELLLKCEDKGPAFITTIFNEMRPGDSLQFQGPQGGLHLDLSIHTQIGMIAGSIGVSPMMQIIRHVLHDKPEGVIMRLLWGARHDSEFLYRDILEHKEAHHRDIFSVWYTVTEPSPVWEGHVGPINPSLIRESMPPPSPNTLIVICGPPAMCNAIKPILKDLGYSNDMVFSYL